MPGVIGPASDFYRIRLTRIDEGDDVEFDWRDDVLWREAPSTSPVERDIWVLEVVTLDETETVTPLAAFSSRESAERALAEAVEDLAQDTKSGFEAEYLKASRGSSDTVVGDVD